MWLETPFRNLSSLWYHDILVRSVSIYLRKFNDFNVKITYNLTRQSDAFVTENSHAYFHNPDGHSRTELNPETLRSSVNEITGVRPVIITDSSTGNRQTLELEHHQR